MVCALWITALIAATACARKPLQLYEGPPRPEVEIAKVSIEPGSTHRLYAVNDVRAHGSEFHLAPGTHEVWIHSRMYESAGDALYKIWTYCRFDLEARAGATYEIRSVNRVIKSDATGKRVQVGAVIVDVDRDTEWVPRYCLGSAPDLN